MSSTRSRLPSPSSRSRCARAPRAPSSSSPRKPPSSTSNCRTVPSASASTTALRSNCILAAPTGMVRAKYRPACESQIPPMSRAYHPATGGSSSGTDRWMCGFLYRCLRPAFFEFGFELVLANAKSKAPAGGQRYENPNFADRARAQFPTKVILGWWPRISRRATGIILGRRRLLPRIDARRRDTRCSGRRCLPSSLLRTYAAIL